MGITMGVSRLVFGACCIVALATAAPLLSSRARGIGQCVPSPGHGGYWCVDFYIEPTNDTIVHPTISHTTRDQDKGWGVDLDIVNASYVHTNIWDDDGDGFFQLNVQNNYCKIDSGSNGLGPGAQVQVYEMNGLACHVHKVALASGNNETLYTLHVTTAATHKEDCKDQAPGSPKNNCPPPMML